MNFSDMFFSLDMINFSKDFQNNTTQDAMPMVSCGFKLSQAK